MTECGTTRGNGNASSIIAACIIAAGLIGAALIVTHRPAAPAAITARTVAPPIAQESARAQFRSQVMAVRALHTFKWNSTVYTLTDVKVTQVIYTPKDDTFTFLYDWLWQPVMPTGGPQSDSTELSNDGYGHYYGSVGIRGYGEASSADVTLR